VSDATAASSARTGADLEALVRAAALGPEVGEASADLEAWLVFRVADTKRAALAERIREIV